MTKRKSWVEISKKALKSNAAVFKSRLGAGVGLMAVVKSNAYGHGLAEAAKTLSPSADWFGVDNLDEAATLRKLGLRQPILALGFTPSFRMAEAGKLGVSLTVSTVEQVKWARAAAEKARRTIRLHLKVETGTNRQGAELKQLPEISEAIGSGGRLVLEGLSTHYANIEDAGDPSFAEEQLDRFNQAVRFLEAHGRSPKSKHTACTAAAVLYPETHFNLARVGIGLYGLWPSPETQRAAEERGLEFGLEPALAWKTLVAQVKEVKRGAPVGYGLTETMPHSGRLAVLGTGYWDGFDRGLSSVGEVIIRGKRAKVLGRVCMNMCMVDVTDIPGARAEDEATLIGRDGHERITAEELAGKLDTISYEVVTRINPLIPRVVV